MNIAGYKADGKIYMQQAASVSPSRAVTKKVPLKSRQPSMNNSLDKSHPLNIEEQQSSVASTQEAVVLTKEQAKKQMEGMFKKRNEREPIDVDIPLYDSKDHHVIRMNNARKKKKRDLQKAAKVGMGLSRRQ